MSPRERLEIHHKAAVARDTADAERVELWHLLDEARLDVRGHGAGLADLEREPRHDAVEHVVGERKRVICPRRRREGVFEANPRPGTPPCAWPLVARAAPAPSSPSL